MLDTKLKGNLTEIECMASFMELGYLVSIPFGEDSRYDFIVDINNKLYKIQCKTCSEKVNDDGEIVAIHFKTCRQTGGRSKLNIRTPYTPEEIDFFATSYNKKCYLVPVGETSNEKTLRIVPPKNGQINGITFLDSCELKEVIKKL